MAQFDVYRNPNKASSRAIPFLVDVQCDHLSGFETRVVIPLTTAEQLDKAARRLNPHFEIDGAALIMMTERLAAVPKQALGPQVTSLAKHRDDILAALDFLILGF